MWPQTGLLWSRDGLWLLRAPADSVSAPRPLHVALEPVADGDETLASIRPTAASDILAAALRQPAGDINYLSSALHAQHRGPTIDCPWSTTVQGETG